MPGGAFPAPFRPPAPQPQGARPPAAPPAAPRPIPPGVAFPRVQVPVAAPQGPGLYPGRVRLVVIRGSPAFAGMAFKLGSQTCPAGRVKGAILFPDDAYLGPLHATFYFRDGQLVLRDEGSPSGTFVRIAGPDRIAPGGLFAAGDRLFRYVGPIPPAATAQAPVPYGAPAPRVPLYVVEEVLEGGRPGRACARLGPVIAIGRVGCELSFANDPSLSGRQCELTVSADGAILRDVGGGEGTYLRLSSGSERVLNAGDFVRIGIQVMRVDVA